MMVKVNKLERRERLLNVCKNIVGGNVDADAVAAFKSATLRYADLQHIDRQQALKNLYQSVGEVGVAVRAAFKQLDDQEYSPLTGAVYPRSSAFFLDLLSPDADPDDEDARTEDDEDDDVEKAKTKEQPMESLTAIMKDIGPIAVAKQIVATGRTFGLSEADYVDAASRYAAALHGLPGDRAFAELCKTDGDVVRACGVLKAAEFSVFDIQPVVVGGADARDVDNATAAVRAYEEIVRIGREKFPFLSADQQFARIFEDRNYAALAAQAHSWPQPTTIYAGPGSTAPGRGAYAKADPVPNADSAYAELMHKAEAYREAHPQLSISQSFEKIYCDRANVALAKRERMESAPR
jgi:hypothetical protein